MPQAKDFSEGDFLKMARKFSAMSEPMRLRIIRTLMDGEKSAGQIAEAVLGTQANVSRHLQKLKDAHILDSRKDGQFVIYFICDKSINKLCKIICDSPQP